MGLLRRLCSIRVLAIAVALVACVSRELVLSSSEQDSTVPLTNFDFGSVQVGSASTAHAFTISPTSNQLDNDTVTSVAAQCPDFTLTAQNLPAMVTNTCSSFNGSGFCTGYTPTSYTFAGRFIPTVVGPTSCTVHTVIDGANGQFTITGTGTEPPIVVSVSPVTPPALDFGDVRVATTSSAQTVTIADLGSSGAGMTVSSVAFDGVSAANGYAIASGNTSVHTVVPGTPDVFTVTCTPPATGPTAGTLTISTNDPRAPTSSVAFSCNGIMSNLQITPSPASLVGTQTSGATRVGEPVDVTIDLSNVGTASLVVDSVALDGSGLAGSDLSITSPPLLATTLNPGDVAHVVVHYAPTQPIAPTTIGSLDLTLEDGAVTDRAVSISGGAFATSMTINGPQSVGDFGPVCVNETVTQNFTVSANGHGAFAITQVDLPAAPFTLAALVPPQLPTAAAPIALLGDAASSATFAVTAAPTAAGSATSSFTVETDIPAGTAQQTIALSVLGLPPGVTASPAAVDLGTLAVGQTSPGHMITLTNCDPTALALETPVITGPDASDFVLVLGGSGMLATHDNASYVVELQPTGSGSLSATLELVYTGGEVDVPLTGEATQPAQPPGSDGSDDTPGAPKSYYTCTAGGGSASWPIGAAWALVLIARRRPRSA